MSPPSGFISIQAARSLAESQTVSFIGILTTIPEQRKTKGDDWLVDFYVQDGEFNIAPQFSSASIRCKLFRRDVARLPSGWKVGDPVLVRNIKVNQFNSITEAVSASRDRAQVFFFPQLSGDQSKLHFKGTEDATPPSAEERAAAIALRKSYLTAVGEKSAAARAPITPAPRDKRMLIKDINAGVYCDLAAVEVVKTWYKEYSTVDLYVADYTANTGLFLYENPDEAESLGLSSKKWSGPYGQVTLAIRLYDPHAAWSRQNVQEGDLICLRNVHIKVSQTSHLEGALHEDTKNPSKIQIWKVTDRDLTAEHDRRKKAYQQQRHTEREARMNPGQPRKASAKASAKRKEEKKERRRLKREQAQKEAEREAEELLKPKAGLNTRVKAGHPDMQLSTVEEILHNPARKATSSKGYEITLPFVNAKYRTCLRVVDFSPHSIEDFARSMQDPAWNTALLDDSVERRRDDRWKWGFALLVEEASVPAGTKAKRFPLFINNDSGQHLLQMDATDLKSEQERRTLDKLEFKLFILWGNLLELKENLGPEGVQFPLPAGDARLQNRPFECCIQEYGAKVPISKTWPLGWQRMYRLVATTIHS